MQDNIVVDGIIRHERLRNQLTEDRFVLPTRALSRSTEVIYKTEVCSSHPISYGIFDNKSSSHPSLKKLNTNEFVSALSTLFTYETCKII